LKHDAYQYATSQISRQDNMASFRRQFNIPGTAQHLDPLIFGWLHLSTLDFGNEFLKILPTPQFDLRRE
jgi:hypothetical protein